MSKTDSQFKYQEERRTYNMGLSIMLADEYIRNFISLSATPACRQAGPADGILLAFVVIFIISSSIGCRSGLDIIKYQHSSKLRTLIISLTNFHIPLISKNNLPRI